MYIKRTNQTSTKTLQSKTNQKSTPRQVKDKNILTGYTLSVVEIWDLIPST